MVTDIGSCVGREWVLFLIKKKKKCGYIILHNRSLLCGWAKRVLLSCKKYEKLGIAIIK